MDDLKLRNQWPLMKTVIVWFVLISILVSGLLWTGVITLPVWLSFQRKAFVASHQYIETKRTSIATMISECKPLKAGPQKQVLRQKIAAQNSLLPIEARIQGGC